VAWVNLFRNRISGSHRLEPYGDRSKNSFPLFRIAVMSGIAALLAVGGTLQYRWNNQIRRAAEVRMGADLESVMMKWNLDFYGEFSAVCVALQVGPDSGANDSWDAYLHRYSNWSWAANTHDPIANTYTNRDLVRDIYIWETSKRGRPRLLLLNPDAGTVESSSISPDLRPLLAHLGRNSSNLRVALRAWQLDGSSNELLRKSSERSHPSQVSRSNAITGWQFDEQIPAIVHPIFHRTHGGGGHNKVSSLDRVDWLVVVLNLETIQKRILPEITQRYFSGGQERDLELAVIAVGRISRLLYSPDPGFQARDISSAAAVMNIFGPPPESTEGHLWQTEKNRQSVKGEDWHNFSSPVWFPIIRQTATDGPWMLVLQNRKGPLDAAVMKVWRSNLLSGGVVLVLLAASMVLVVLASQHAQGLANLQMKLRRAVEQLELQVRARTLELQQRNEDLLAEITERERAQESLRSVSGSLLQLQEEERRRIARELHDSSAQLLGAIAINMERAQRLALGHEDPDLNSCLLDCADLLAQVTLEVRTLSYLLHPPMLGELGLQRVLPRFVEGFSRRSGIAVDLIIQPNLGRFPLEVELTLFRITQEALTNIHRHSGSHTAVIVLIHDSQSATLEIKDQGRGIPPGLVETTEGTTSRLGVGIAGMQERVRQLGGKLEIICRPGGTDIRAILPLAIALPANAFPAKKAVVTPTPIPRSEVA
jgi:signal transduction histidine kinase